MFCTDVIKKINDGDVDGGSGLGQQAFRVQGAEENMQGMLAGFINADQVTAAKRNPFREATEEDQAITKEPESLMPGRARNRGRTL